MANHEIFVDREVVQGQQHAVPHGIPNFMNVGDTVQYLSKVNDLVMIKFDGPATPNSPSSLLSPFNDLNGNEMRVVRSTDGKVTVSNPGIFFCKCFLTAPGQLEPEIGWGPNSPQSGGNHDVH